MSSSSNLYLLSVLCQGLSRPRHVLSSRCLTSSSHSVGFVSKKKARHSVGFAEEEVWRSVGFASNYVLNIVINLIPWRRHKT
jgi:hypothetical protein